MKLSVNLPAADLEFLDSYARVCGCGSRSAALREAVQLLRRVQLGRAYEHAFLEWEASGEGRAWEVTIGDG
jgi:Arc/MetJ-type ribon-helix-helix transcriptional regulator